MTSVSPHAYDAVYKFASQGLLIRGLVVFAFRWGRRKEGHVIECHQALAW